MTMVGVSLTIMQEWFPISNELKPKKSTATTPNQQRTMKIKRQLKTQF